MSLDDSVRRFLEDPDNDENAKNHIRALAESHLTTGMKLQQRGLLREAIAEFRKENDRPINTDVDKEIAQMSYVHIGMAYRKLGETDEAKAAFERGRELWKQYGIGSAPHYYLAEILIEQGRLDKSIEVCQELLEHIPDGGVKQLLAKALDLKEGKSK